MSGILLRLELNHQIRMLCVHVAEGGGGRGEEGGGGRGEGGGERGEGRGGGGRGEGGGRRGRGRGRMEGEGDHNMGSGSCALAVQSPDPPLSPREMLQWGGLANYIPCQSMFWGRI